MKIITTKQAAIKATIVFIAAIIPFLSFSSGPPEIITSTIFIKDTVVLELDEYQGELQWQKSGDLINWEPLQSGNPNSLSASPENNMYFRALVNVPGCDPYYSDTVFVEVDKVYLPTVSIVSISSVTEASVELICEVSGDGGASISKKGIIWSQDVDPNTLENPETFETGEGIGQFLCNMTNLKDNTKYYIRAFSSNRRGTSYSDLLQITTPKRGDVLPEDTISGLAQKGPFVIGSSLIISELNSELTQTGKSFSSSIHDNSGSFGLSVNGLESPYVHLRADGFYFNEVKGELSNAQLTLTALSNLTDRDKININVMSHLERERVLYLISSGLSFLAAKQQAQQEIMDIFEISKDDIDVSEGLDISKDGDENAILLAISLILQGYRTEAGLSQLMANISADIKTDGVLNNTLLGAELINDAMLLDLTQIRENLETRFGNINPEAIVPNFEKYIQQFIDNTSFIPDKTITYPKNGINGANILHDDITEINPQNGYSMRAELPTGTSLKLLLKYSGNNPEEGGYWAYSLGSVENYTVETYNFTNHTQLYTVKNDAEYADIHIMFPDLSSGAYNVTIDFYENNSNISTHTKELQISSSFANDSSDLPVILTKEVTSISSNSAITGGKFFQYSADSIFYKGVCWDTIPNPTPWWHHTEDGMYQGNYTSYLSNLLPQTTYYVRAFVVVWPDTVYGNEITFTTLSESGDSTYLPEVITKEVNNITAVSAFSGGYFLKLGSDPVLQKGVCWNGYGTPLCCERHTQEGNGTDDFTSYITGLSADSSYYLRAYAITQNDTVYGQTKTFATLGEKPILFTDSLSTVLDTSVLVFWHSQSTGSGFRIQSGVCWNIAPEPTIHNNKTNDGGAVGFFTSNISSFDPGILYYIRAYMITSKDTAYGNELTFMPDVPNLKTDSIFTDSRDERSNKMFQIGYQVWTAENLAYLPSISPSSTGSGSEPHFYVYDYEATNVDSAKSTFEYQTHGVLYNWPAAMIDEPASSKSPSDVKGICPDGWHLPSDAEWTELEIFLQNSV